MKTEINVPNATAVNTQRKTEAVSMVIIDTAPLSNYGLAEFGKK